MGTGSSPNECPSPPGATSATASSAPVPGGDAGDHPRCKQLLDVNRDDYYGNGATSDDLRDSPHLDALAAATACAVSGAWQGSGMISMSFPAPLDCRTCASSSTTSLPSRSSRRRLAVPPPPRWSGACKGEGSSARHSPRRPNGQRALRANVPPGPSRRRKRPRIERARRLRAGRCSAAFEAGSHVSLRATAVAGHRFAGWAGAAGRGSLHHPARPRSVCSRDVR